MKKIGVDIKNGQFVVYPSGEVLSSLEGYINKAYFKQVGTTQQLKVVLIKEDTEYTLNCITGNVTFQSLVTELICNTNSYVKITLELNNNGIKDFYLVKLELPNN